MKSVSILWIYEGKCEINLYFVDLGGTCKFSLYFVDLCGTCEFSLYFVDLGRTCKSVCILWIYAGLVNSACIL